MGPVAVIGPGQQRWLIALWLLLSLGVAASLFPILGVSPAMALIALGDIPAIQFLPIIVLTLVNQLAGAQKWRIAMRHLGSGPTSGGLFVAFESTALGAFFGQVIPIQISTALVRRARPGTSAGERSLGIAATIYEQGYDLLVLVFASLGAVAAVFWKLSLTKALCVALLAVTLGIAAFQATIKLFAGLTSQGRQDPRARARERLARYAAVLMVASSVPTGAVVRLAALSLVRMACMIGRLAVIAAVLAPDADRGRLAVAYPVFGIAASLPLTPAGLGIAEWSWAGLLVFSGSQRQSAVSCAFALRLANMTALLVILCGIGLFHASGFLRRRVARAA